MSVQNPLIVDFNMHAADAEQTISFEFGTNNTAAEISFGMSNEIRPVIVECDEYEGPQTVTPKIEDQTLETKDNLLTDDVLVREIPYYETSNQQNGLTVFIANTLND